MLTMCREGPGQTGDFRCELAILKIHEFYGYKMEKSTSTSTQQDTSDLFFCQNSLQYFFEIARSCSRVLL